MDFIAYNTSLDIRTIVKLKQEKRSQDIQDKADSFAENKKKLMPYVLKYLHYLTDLHNSVVIRSCFVEQYLNDVRVMGKQWIGNGKDAKYIDGKLELADVIERYTRDTYFENNGTTYYCISFQPLIARKVSIWLNSRAGCYVHNPEMEYTIADGSNRLTYYDSIEHWIEELAERWINSERHGINWQH